MPVMSEQTRSSSSGRWRASQGDEVRSFPERTWSAGLTSLGEVRTFAWRPWPSRPEHLHQRATQEYGRLAAQRGRGRLRLGEPVLSTSVDGRDALETARHQGRGQPDGKNGCKPCVPAAIDQCAMSPESGDRKAQVVCSNLA